MWRKFRKDTWFSSCSRIKPPATPTFEEIRSRVESQFKNERAGFLLQQKTQELSDRAKAGHDLKKAAKDLGATVKTSELVAARWPGSRHRFHGERKCDLCPEAGRHQRPDHRRRQWRGRSTPRKTGADRSGIRREEGRDPSSRSSKPSRTICSACSLRTCARRWKRPTRLKVNQEEMKNLTRQSRAEEGS